LTCVLIYVAWYGLGRFFIEGLRTGSLFFTVFGTDFRISQLIAAASFVIAILILIINFFRKKKKSRDDDDSVNNDSDDENEDNGTDSYSPLRSRRGKAVARRRGVDDVDCPKSVLTCSSMMLHTPSKLSSTTRPTLNSVLRVHCGAYFRN